MGEAHFRLHSFYYDKETGLYYNGYHYYDSVNNKYIVDSTKDFLNFDIAPRNSGLYYAVSAWRDSLLRTSSFGTPISYSSTWYSNLSDVELLTRLIYAENTLNARDQTGVAWVLINRRNSSSFPSNYRSVATQSGQFQPITGGSSSSTSNARIPDTSSPRWQSATWAACLLLITSSSSDYNSLLPRPSGISNQLYFNGLNYFLGSPPTIDSTTGIRYSFNNGNTYVNLTDIVIIFPTGTTYQNPFKKSDITNHQDLNTFNKRAHHNIFYNIN